MRKRRCMRVYDELAPIYDAHSRVLILGSMPSKTSRALHFYYAHPQNRFWPVMEILFHTTLTTNEDKVSFLLNHHIALYDVIQSCEIAGSSDASIRGIVLNPLEIIFQTADIKKVFTTGQTAGKLYQRYFGPCEILPSPSSANARYRLEDLVKCYAKILDYI